MSNLNVEQVRQQLLESLQELSESVNAEETTPVRVAVL